MGSTFVDFRNQGFEASDSSLEVWLSLLVIAIDELPQVPDWLAEAREEWHIHATQCFGFGVMPGLDRVATTPERCETILGLCSTAMQRLLAYGPEISKDALNALVKTEERAWFTGDVAARHFIPCGEYFIKLLRGELKPEESDARFPVI